MERDFWLGLWERGRIPFHAHAVNPFLSSHISALKLSPGARIFLPLCGKTVDVGWLRARSYRIAGVELSALAVEQLFDNLGEAPEIEPRGALTRYSARNVEIWHGDIFDLTAKMLGPVDAVYDRAALIALPASVRPSYSAHLVELTAASPQLLLTFDDSGGQDDGPPFRVAASEVRRLYGTTHEVSLLEDVENSSGGDRDQIWLLNGIAA